MKHAPLILTMLLAGLMGWFVATHLSVTTDITHFLPGGDEDTEDLAALSRELAGSTLTRTVVISLKVQTEDGKPNKDGATPQTLHSASKLVAELNKIDQIAWIRSTVADEDQQAVYDLYFPRRWYFLARDPGQRAQRLSDDGLRKAAKDLLDALRGPQGPLVRRIAEEDPLLIFPAVLRRLKSMRRGDLTVQDGQFVTPDGWVIIILATEASPFDSRAMRPFASALDDAIDHIRSDVDGELMVEQSGVYRFALASEDAIRSDITRISIASTVGILLLFLVVFRVFRYTLLGFLPLGMGVLTGMSVALLSFGQIHGLTLAFGSALIGVVIDYPVHFFNHHSLEPSPDGPEATAIRIWPALLLGASTTVAGFVGLAFTSFPGLREMAVFAAAGVFSALLVTRFVLPSLMPSAPPVSRLQRRLAKLLAGLNDSASQQRKWLWLLPGLAILLGAIGIPQVRWVDDPGALNELDPALQAEEERVRGRVSQMDMGRFVVATGPDEQTALKRYETVENLLAEARQEGELSDFQTLVPLLWSRATQESNQKDIRDHHLPTRLPPAFKAEGFAADAFSNLSVESTVAPLTSSDLLGSPLAQLSSGFRVELETGVAYLGFLRGVKDPGALDARARDLDGVYFFDQSQFLSRTYETVRERTLEMILLGLLGVLGVLFFRYRDWRLVLAAFFPSVLAAAATLGALGLLGQQTNMLHVVSLLLVLSIGVDYSVFLAESHRAGEGWSATLLSIVMACASTILAFGLLAMSDMPALHAIGSTVGLGVLLSLLLAPSAMLLSRE